MATLTEVKDALAKYVADVEAFRVTVQTAVADALAADEANDEVDLQALKDTIDAADANLTPPTV